jgi:hypothetical protein
MILEIKKLNEFCGKRVQIDLSSSVRGKETGRLMIRLEICLNCINVQTKQGRI